MSVSVFCNWILQAIVAQVHYWPCPVLSAKEMRSMKVGSACVRALLRRKCCVRHREFSSLLREYARWHCWCVAISDHVINLTLTPGPE